MAVDGTIYLLHFSGTLGTAGRNSARHYLGWAPTGRLDARIAEHRAGVGASITRAAVAAGMSLTVVATWDGTRDDERRMKRNGHHDRRCVVCRAGAVVERPIYRVEVVLTNNYLIDGDR